MRLRTKIPLLLTPLVVIPLLLLGAVAYTKLERTTVDGIATTGAEKLSDISHAVAREVAVASANLQLLTGNVLLEKYAVIDDRATRYSLLQRPLLDLFSASLAAFPEYREIRFLLPDGTEDVRQTLPYVDNVSEQEGGSAVFRALVTSGGGLHATMYRNPDTGQPALFVGTAVVLRDNASEPLSAAPTLRGYLAITHALNGIAEMIEQAQIGAHGFLFATDDTGAIVFPRAQERQPQLPSNFAQTADSLLDIARPRAVRVGGQTMLLAGTRVAGNLRVYSALPLSELDGLRREARIVVIVVVVLAMVVTLVTLTSVLDALVVRPIRSLEQMAAAIGRGHWDVESGVQTGDEMGALGRAFEDMARNLGSADDRVRFLAYHDNLTGLPNREMFREYLTRALAHARRSEERLGVLFLDIDGFKRINDTLGHQAGDLLLQEVAKRLSDRLRDEDMIVRSADWDGGEGLLARLGGDEFIVLLTSLRDAHAPGVVARRFIKAIGEAIELNGQDCYIGASIGIAIYPDDGADAGELIKNADIAMYHAKNLGKNSYQYFQSSMNAAIVERAALEARLRKAIADGQFSLHYQPQVDARTHEIVGVEALMRWYDPDNGHISPGAFIPLAEETGLILPLGEWAIDEACRQAREWQLGGVRPVPISVNVSAVQFERQDVAQLVRDALARHHLPGARIEIEITESAIMGNPERAVAALGEIRNAGVGIALDDFGTGYSSLSYLRRFPIDTLKIDRSFILQIHENREDAEIVAAITAMAHTLGLRVIVEGIENEAQLAVTVARQCDIVQGYVFYRPMPPPDIAALLSERRLQSA